MRPLMGAAHKGRNEVIQLLVDRGAKLDARDKGSRDTGNAASKIAGHRFQVLEGKRPFEYRLEDLRAWHEWQQPKPNLNAYDECFRHPAHSPLVSDRAALWAWLQRQKQHGVERPKLFIIACSGGASKSALSSACTPRT